jgi:hypothetical protein
VAGAFQFGRNRVGVAYSQGVDVGSALTTGNYSLSPGLAVTASVLQDNGRTVILETATDLTAGQAYDLTVTGVLNTQGAGLESAGPFPFSAPVVTGAVNIDELHAAPGTFDGGQVTVFGQVTVPTGSRGGTANGFIQDGSGRGIRLKGGLVLAEVNSRGNAAVTGTFHSAPGPRSPRHRCSLATGCHLPCSAAQAALRPAWRNYIETWAIWPGRRPDQHRHLVMPAPGYPLAGYQVARCL